MSDQRQVIAHNPQWTITAVGDLQASGRGFRANLVRFEAARLGVPYADGELYVSGPHDHSFESRYESREWIDRNALRLAHSSRDLVTVELRVRNESSRTVKYVIINTDELFLLLDLQPLVSMTLPARRWGDYTDITLHGVFDNGESFHATSETFGEQARRLEVTVLPEGIHFNEAR